VDISDLPNLLHKDQRERGGGELTLNSWSWLWKMTAMMSDSEKAPSVL
jgi:hypothetical protein